MTINEPNISSIQIAPIIIPNINHLLEDIKDRLPLKIISPIPFLSGFLIDNFPEDTAIRPDETFSFNNSGGT